LTLATFTVTVSWGIISEWPELTRLTCKPLSPATFEPFLLRHHTARDSFRSYWRVDASCCSQELCSLEKTKIKTTTDQQELLRSHSLHLTLPLNPIQTVAQAAVIRNSSKQQQQWPIEKDAQSISFEVKDSQQSHTLRRHPCQGMSRSQTLLPSSPWWCDLGPERGKPCTSSEHTGCASHTTHSGRAGDGAHMEHVITMLITFSNQLA
jgi:hypothetical protein